MKEIQLTQGKVTLVDDEDYEYLNQWRWRFNKLGYAVRRKLDEHIYMHRIIMNTSSGLEVDHIDHNGLNNQRSNLRICTHKQNCRNFKSNRKYKGIHRLKGRIQIYSRIRVNDKQVYLGSFKTIEEAARAYDKAAILYFGEFANLNFKEERQLELNV